jgi:lysyl-tRNA synthetase class 2
VTAARARSEVTPDTGLEELRKLAAAHDVELKDGLSAGEVVLELSRSSSSTR